MSNTTHIPIITRKKNAIKDICIPNIERASVGSCIVIGTINTNKYITTPKKPKAIPKPAMRRGKVLRLNRPLGAIQPVKTAHASARNKPGMVTIRTTYSMPVQTFVKDNSAKGNAANKPIIANTANPTLLNIDNFFESIACICF